ncbi:MAG: hypothetical protein JW952_04350 [Candidatus Eisenbacteria bacterium]|nr:hypothetical protein [Candidatus Eisenbacteria bacterium]
MTETYEAALNQKEPVSADAAGRVASFLVLETRGELYAVRWTLVREAGIVLPQDVCDSAGRPEVRRRGESFPLYHLWELVGQEKPTEAREEMAAVYLEENGNRMVLVPERILWKQDGDLRPLPQWLERAPVVAGVISLPSGVAVVVVEPFDVKEHECL